jgi:HEAT repeat protein
MVGSAADRWFLFPVACSTIRDIDSVIRTGDEPPKSSAEKAAAAAQEAKEVAALVKKLNDTSTAWKWAWNSGNPTYGPSAQSDRVAAAYALGHQYKAYSAIPDLARALEDKDADLRVNASSSLLAMADHAAPAQAALEEALNDPYNRVRLNAVRALQQMGVPNAGLMPALDGVVSGSSLCDAVEAADLLLSMGRAPKSLVPVLIQGMADPELSEVVIADLGELREDPAYLPVLLMGLKSDNPKVTAGSVRLLAGASYASPEVTAAIRAATSDSAPDVRANAAAALVAG